MTERTDRSPPGAASEPTASHGTAVAGGDVRSVYMTFPDEETAVRIASSLLERRLIACANVMPAGRSIYRWQGETEDEAEVVAFAKTTERRIPDVVALVRELHPYDVPCIVVLEVPGGDPHYLQWVAAETAHQT